MAEFVKKNISLPADLAERLSQESNASGLIAGLLRDEFDRADKFKKDETTHEVENRLRRSDLPVQGGEGRYDEYGDGREFYLVQGGRHDDRRARRRQPPDGRARVGGRGLVRSLQRVRTARWVHRRGFGVKSVTWL